MAHRFNSTVTGEELAGYGCGLDELTTVDVTTLFQRAELVSTVIHRLLNEEEQVLDTLIKEVNHNV